ncbi:MAG: tRNA uridine-5-carboxymethylaminomethyl(34) synthesis GTPase MnmE, partial [Saprospiraceae bacterium]|nr:tRNA uridine-5-carboxymethylaminomethyl(34) synthesis GTPase MnmE [Saprospiraceae bacterium]
MLNHHDTIIALATPNGTGAIAVIRLSGSQAIILTDQVFLGKKLSKQPSHTLHYGQIIDEQQQVVDEVVVSLFKAPHSYTKEDTVEISCHGSPYIIQQLLQLFIRKGVRLARAGEFTLRAFLNGRMDLSQAEAVADLIAASDKATHNVALRQMRGGFGKKIQQLRSELIHFASMIELELDFAEEDVVFADKQQLQQLIYAIQNHIRTLSQSFTLGNAIKNGINTVIAGRPNAGKSTLLNVLLNEERAIVSDVAGTTRDTIEETLTIGGITFRLIDTAGIREATDTIETIGVQRTYEKVKQSAILIYVFDVLELTPAEVAADIDSLYNEQLKIIIVPNKMDLNPYAKPENFISLHVGDKQIVPTAAISNMNIEYLKEKLLSLIIGDGILLESPIVTNTRHFEALQHTDRALQDVLDGLAVNVGHDFLAMDIRRALHYLGEISGDIT